MHFWAYAVAIRLPPISVKGTPRPSGAGLLAPPGDTSTPSGAHGRSLLLFEDFDQLVDLDDGFLASVATLLLQSKARLAFL
jgi:hypothetical protein